MQGYEKRFNFDKRYKKLQSMNFEQKVLVPMFGIISFLIGYLGLKYILLFIPDAINWRDVDVWFTFLKIPFYKVDIIYFAFGFIFTVIGSVRLSIISKHNHSVKNIKTNKPYKLLTDGYYAKARHPMYGTFIFINSGLFLSLRSLWGIMIAVLVIGLQYFNARSEEQHTLIPLFGDEYMEYIKKVPSAILSKTQFAIIMIFIAFSILKLIIS